MIPIKESIAIGVFGIGFGLGFWAAYELQSITINSLRADIANIQYQAQKSLNEANKAVKEIEDAQVKTIIEIQEQANEAININHDLTEQLRIARLQHTKARSNTARLPKACDTGDTESAAKTVDISARYNQFIDERAAIADYNTAYAQAAYSFVHSIPKELIK